MSLLRNQTEHLTLARPFDREVAKSGHAHSVGKAPIDGRLDGSGARNASEIVMLTFRTVQSSRLAMLSVFAVGSVMSSSSQRRHLSGA